MSELVVEGIRYLCQLGFFEVGRTVVGSGFKRGEKFYHAQFLWYIPYGAAPFGLSHDETKGKMRIEKNREGGRQVKTLQSPQSSTLIIDESHRLKVSDSCWQ